MDVVFNNLTFFSVKGIMFMVFCILGIMVVGYALGRIDIKGVSLGTAGVFIVALLFGALLGNRFLVHEVGASMNNVLKSIENIGLIFFVTAVGLIAGPNFFKDLRKNFKSYVSLGLLIIIIGGVSCVGCLYLARTLGDNSMELPAMLVGVLSGSLTSTPAFSAAKDTVADMAAGNPALAEHLEGVITVGHGIAYLFGVVGVVLFVQIIPKLVKANMEEERAKILIDDGNTHKEYKGKLLDIDEFGLAAFAFSAIVGILLGSIKFPLSLIGLSGTFSLGTTGGVLIAALVFGHFGRIGCINFTIDHKVLRVFRELGLMLFLIGAGIPGGIKFVEYFKVSYFIYGVIMTILPMVVGYFVAKYILKFPLLNNLGSITGGMTSTPALGTLIGVAKTDNVAASYASTYPIALVSVVLVSQVILLIWQEIPAGWVA